MPTYSFQMSAGLAGSSVSVTAVGSSAVVASGTLDTNALFTASLPVGDYVAKAADGHYSYSSAGTVAASDPDQLAELSYTYAPVETQRRAYELGRQIDATDSSAAYSKFVAGGMTVTPSTTPDPKVGPYLTFAAAGVNGTLYRAVRDVNLDLSRSFLSFWIRVNDANLANFKVNTGAKGSTLGTGFDVFGANVRSADLTPGTWHRLTVDLADGFAFGGADVSATADIRNVGFSTTGGGSATSFDIADIRIHPKGSQRGGVVFQFDDASSETYATAYPILKAAGFVGNIPMEVDKIGTAGRMTIAQLSEVYNAGWELSGHHSLQIPSMSDSAAETAFRQMVALNRDNGWKRGANFFVWPGGIWDAGKQDIALRYFTNLRRVGSTNNYATPWVSNRRSMPMSYITTSTSVASVKAFMDKASTYGSNLVLVFHKIMDSGATAENWLTSDFQQVVTYAKTIGLHSTTLTDLYGDGS